MSRQLIYAITLLGLLTAGVVQAASVDQAKKYVQNRELAAAKLELEQVLASGAGEKEMAAALDLMASIAVEEKDYSTAAELWERLVADYPKRAEELGAETKLQLAQALTGQEEHRVASEPAAEVPPPVPSTPEPIAEAPTEPEPAEPTATAPSPAPPAAPEPVSTPQPVRATELPAPAVPGLVLVATAGKPYDAAEYAGAKLTAFLVESGVNAESPTGGIPVVEDSATSLARMLKTVEDRGAESLAFMRVNFQSWQRIAVEVYTPDGALLWKEGIRGGTGYTGRPYSKTGANEKLLQRFFDKVAKRVGGPGLPVTR